MKVMRRKSGSWLAMVVAGALLTGAAPAAEGTVSVDAPGQGVTIKSGDNSINFGAWGQFRWVGDDKEDFDGDASGSGVGREDGFSSSFSIPRLRAYFQGTVYRPWIGYRFELEFSTTNTDGSNKIKDGYVELTRVRMAAVRLGQYKVPFSLQELNSDQRGEFPERAITNAKFAAGRDLGVMLWGTTADKKFGYQAGIFNGGGEGRSQDDQKLMGAARVWTAPLGEYKASEGPLENTGAFVFHVGAGVRTGETARGSATPGVFERVDNERAWNVETAVRVWRVFGTAEYFQMTDELENPVEAPTLKSRGWHAQVGVMVVPKHLEIAARYAVINPDRDASDAAVTEKRLALSYFLSGHAIKLQLDGGRITYGAGLASISSLGKRNLPALGTRLTTGSSFHDDQYRLQAQVVF